MPRARSRSSSPEAAGLQASTPAAAHPTPSALPPPLEQATPGQPAPVIPVPPPQLILSHEPLVEGVLLKRYKRFLADVALEGGEVVTVHCPNTGPMSGVLHPGGRVRLRHAPSPTRKLAWTWEQAEAPGADGTPVWVGVNTALPNRLVRATIEAGCLEPWLGPIATIRAEVPYGVGRRSRIDLLLTPAPGAADPRPLFVEVKNTTWTQGDLALFPDTVTERGQKHLEELIHLLPEARPVLVPCVSREDGRRFAPGDRADPRYGELFRQALAAGVMVLPCRYAYSGTGVRWLGLAAVEERGCITL